MKILFLKITLHFYLIIKFIKCFQESNIQFLVDHVETQVKNNQPQYLEDYHRMPFNSFKLNPTNPSFTISGKLDIHNTVNHDQKLVMFGYDELLSKSSLFIRQQYAANSYQGQMTYSIDKRDTKTQFTISLRRTKTQIDIDITIYSGYKKLYTNSTTITNMLDWNLDYTVQFSDSGVSVPSGQREEYSAQGSVYSVFLIRNVYIGSYGEVARLFIQRLTLNSQEGISLFNKYSQISGIGKNCIPDESIARTICAKSKKIDNNLPEVKDAIATFKQNQDIIFENLSYYQFFTHYNTYSQSFFFTYSFWLNLDKTENTPIQVLKQSSIKNFNFIVNLIYEDNNRYRIQVRFETNKDDQNFNFPVYFNTKKFYYLIISYYQILSSEVRVIIIDETGLIEYSKSLSIGIILFDQTIPQHFNFTLQVGKEENQQVSKFQLSQFQMNLSAAILYDEKDIPVSVVDSIDGLQNCQVVILVRLKYQCLICKVTFYLFENTCIKPCGSDYTPDKNIRICVRKCSYRCLECNLSDPNKCISCSSADRDLSTNCGCISGYEDTFSSDCSNNKIQFRKTFKKPPLVIPLVTYLDNKQNYLKQIKAKPINISKTQCTLDIELSSLGITSYTFFRLQILAISMDAKKYYSNQLNFNTAIAAIYQQNIEIGEYDKTIYGDYQILTFISGIMIGQNTTYDNIFADFQIEVVNNNQQIQVTVNENVKNILVTYLVLPASVPSLSQSFTFKSGTFYYDTSNTYSGKVHSDTKSIKNSFMQQKRYLFTSFFSLTAMGYQLSLGSCKFAYLYASQNDLDQQYTRFEFFNSQASQYSTNGFYFIEEYQPIDKCIIKDYYTQEGCYKCKILLANYTNDCNSCYGNRVLNPSSCDCPDPDFKNVYKDENSCSYQNIAVLDINLSTDFSKIIIDFGLMIEPIQYQLQFDPSYGLCEHLFSDSTLDKIKKSAECQISKTLIFIYLDSDAIIQNGDQIQFKQNIKFIKYTNKITSFLRNIVRQDTLSYVADVVISYNQEIISCEKNRLIQVLEFKNHQRRGLKSHVWSLISSSPSNNLNNLSQFQQYILNVNQKKDLVLDISGYFQENSIVTLSLNYEYNIGISGKKEITFKVVEKYITLKSITKRSPPFYIKDKIEIFFKILYYKCDINGNPVQISPSTYNLQYKTTDNLELANTIPQTTQQSFSIEIPSYKTTPNTNYKITITCSVSGTTDSCQMEHIVPILPVPLLIKINGGNRQFDYNEEITISSVSLDLDVLQIKNQSLGIDLVWSCMTLETFEPCKDIENQIIQIPQGSSSITFPKLTFLSYQTNQFTLIGKKGNKIEQDKISILFVDRSIPQINISWPNDFLLQETINMNDIIESEIIVDSNTDINLLFFGAAILYNREVKATITFEYGKFRIQLWNYPLNFEKSNSKFQFRIFVFDPKYTQPSSQVFQFKINFPPSNCVLNISPFSGYSLQTLFTIQVSQCEDPDQPLTYQFYYYTQKQLFDLEVKSPLLVQRKLLSDPILESMIQSYLPSGELFILVQIFDSKNAIKNITQTLTIQQSIYDQQSYINQVQNIINYSSSQIKTSQILSLSLLCEDIVSRTSYYNILKDQAYNIVNILQQLTTSIPKHSTFSLLATQSIQKIVHSKIFEIDTIFLQSNYNYISGILEKATFELYEEQYLQSKSNQQLYNCFVLLDTIADKSQNNLEDSQSLIKYTEKIGNLLNVDAYPNESAKILKGQKISIVSQIITNKKLPIYLGNQDELGSWENQANDQVNKDPINQVYDVSFKSYEQNIYEYDEAYQNLIKKIQQMKPNLKLNSYKAMNPTIYLHESKIEYVPQTNIKFQFQPIKNEPLTCINKVKGQWSAQGCESVYNKKSKLYSCICDDLSPTTVINDVEDIFSNNENLDTIFSEDGIQNILGFDNFQDYAAFWVQCFIAIIFIIFSLFGMFLDNLKQTQTQLGQIASKPDSPNIVSIPSQENQILKYEDITETIEDKQIQKSRKTLKFPKSNTETERVRLSTKNDFIFQIESAFKNKNDTIQTNHVERKTSINTKDQTSLKNIQEEDSFKLCDRQSSRQISDNHILEQRSSQKAQDFNQNTRNKFKSVGLIKSMYYFHDLFSIFLMFDPSISRVQRLVIMYLKNLHLFTSNIVFNKQYSIVQIVFLQLINIIMTVFVTKLIDYGISKNIILRRISQFILLSLILFYYYAFLAVISGTQPSETNKISMFYFIVLLSDIFVVGIFLGFLQRFIANHILLNTEQIVGFRLTILNFLKFQLIIINL